MTKEDEKKKGAIQTTGEMREFLVLAMLGVKNGDLTVERAEQIQKLAGHVNDSLYSEAKLAAFIAHAGGQPPRLGELELGRSEVEGRNLLPPKGAK